MAKQKTVYVCSECGYETARWLGKCPECDSWNTLTEQEAVHGGNGFAALESGENRPAVSDGSGETAQCSSEIAGGDSRGKKNHERDLQNIQRHDGKTGFFAQYATGIAAAQIFAAVFPDVGLVKQLANHQRKGD